MGMSIRSSELFLCGGFWVVANGWWLMGGQAYARFGDEVRVRQRGGVHPGRRAEEVLAARGGDPRRTIHEAPPHQRKSAPATLS